MALHNISCDNNFFNLIILAYPNPANRLMCSTTQAALQARIN